jgi:hypothetical protein
MSASNQAIRTLKTFEMYVRYIWPFHRLFVKNQITRRCVRCVFSEKRVKLDAAGVCELCRKASESPTPKRAVDHEDAKALNQILAGAQGKGQGSYDALVLFSGGKDSTYLIHRMQDEFPKLRMLTMTIHNGFMSPIALENVNDMVGRLGVNHVLVRPSRDFYIKLFRHMLTHLNEDGAYGTVDFSDGEFLLDTARRIAAEKKIPLIIAGYSRYQVQNGLKIHKFESPRSTECANRTHVAHVPLTDIFDKIEIRNWWHGASYPSQEVARLLFPLYAWDLEESEIRQKVTEWGLLTRALSSPILTNHQLIALFGVVDVHQMGYSSFEIEFCRMIREGRAKKEEWLHVFELLEYTARTGMFIKPLILQSLEQLRLSKEDVGIKFTGE